jgi:predicted PurR-regulated permease PerM
VTLQPPSSSQRQPEPVRLETLPSVRAVVRITITVICVILSLYLLYLLRRPIGCIIVAGFLAIALSGPVSLLSRRMRRGLAIAVVYVLLILIPIAVVGILVPPIVTQGNTLVRNVPAYATDVQSFVEQNNTLRRLQQDYDITGQLRQQAEQLPARFGDAAGVLSGIGLGLVNSIFQAVTILILSVFMLGGGPRFRAFVLRHQPPDRAQWIEGLTDRIRSAVGSYVAAALAQALIAAVLAWLVLTVLGVPFALPLAVVIFLLDLVPLVGATIGAVLVGLVTLFSDFPVDTIVWTIWAIAYQQVENNVIQPRIQSRAVALEPFLVLVSVLFGSTLFGIPGALLAIPIAAAIQITVREVWQLRRTTIVAGPDAIARVEPGNDPP